MKNLLVIIIILLAFNVHAQKKATNPKNTRTQVKVSQKYPPAFYKDDYYDNNPKPFSISRVTYVTTFADQAEKSKYYVHIGGSLIDENKNIKPFGFKHYVKSSTDLLFYKQIFDEKSFKKIVLVRDESALDTKTYINTKIEVQY